MAGGLFFCSSEAGKDAKFNMVSKKNINGWFKSIAHNSVTSSKQKHKTGNLKSTKTTFGKGGTFCKCRTTNGTNVKEK